MGQNHTKTHYDEVNGFEYTASASLGSSQVPGEVYFLLPTICFSTALTFFSEEIFPLPPEEKLIYTW